MLAYLIRHWAAMCLPIAIFIMFSFTICAAQLGTLSYWVLLQIPIYFVHEFEEHCYPGGFKNFLNKIIFGVQDKDVPLNDRNIFWINITVIWLGFPLFGALAQLVCPEYGAVLACFSLFNATTHILMGLLKRQYNPGLWCSLFLNYPAGLYTLHLLSQANQLTLFAQQLGWGISLIVHVFLVLYALCRYKEYQKEA